MQMYSHWSTPTPLIDVFLCVDDFGNELDFGSDVVDVSQEHIVPVGAWFYMQGQALADCWDDDIDQDGFGI